ncbi:MAG: carbohydrate binding family 9 domain-containing protein, partial [Lentisphaeria bacterium]|nr:carbohydrate binding family 9 domain-containing protein [Lentisphaeria bacterium]
MNRRKDWVLRWLPLAAAVVGSVAWGVETKVTMRRKTGQTLPFVVTAAVRTNAPPVVDGKLDDGCWTQASLADEFVLYGGRGYAVEQTDARMLWDDKNLYIGMRCFDSNIAKLKKETSEHDGLVCGDDCVEIFFTPPDNPILAKTPEGERYFHIAVNALGTCWDETGMNSPERWNARWSVATSIHKDRWEVELAMPWSALKAQPTDGDVWTVNFNRGLPARGKLQEYSGWSITFAGFHDPDHFGRVIFLERQPTPGSKVVAPEIVARIVQGSELDPFLDRTSALLAAAQAKLRTISDQTKLRQIMETLGETNKLAAEASARRKSLETLPPTELLDTWEARKSSYEKALRSTETLTAKADFYGGLSQAQLSGREPIPDFKVFILPAITNVRTLPRRLPAHALPGRTIELTACPLEYESANFALYALADLKDIRLTASDLTCPAGTVPASALDLRVVKVWYQGGHGIGFQNLRLLTPELLLKDDSLVRIDEVREVNILKMDKDAMRDADTLQPFAVPAGTTKQCWITVQVPASAKAGTYRGTIRIAPADGTAVSVPVSLRVLPFTLDEPKIICSIYYRAKLGTGAPKCNSERKTEEQLLAEFRDMLAHGVTNPTVYQPPGPDLERYLDLREQAGMRGGPLLFLGGSWGSGGTTAEATIAMAKKRGFSDVYFYGQDERKGDELRAQLAWYDRIHAAGGKVFVAGYKDSYEIMGR